MIEKEKTCFFTGHRILAKEDLPFLTKHLPLEIQNLYEKGTDTFLAGGALGFDTLAAKAVLHCKEKLPDLRLILALPCPEQAVKWSLAQQKEYEYIKAMADETVYVSPHYDAHCMMRRNRYMADHSHACIFYLTHMFGGTFRTVSYAMEQELDMHNILNMK